MSYTQVMDSWWPNMWSRHSATVYEFLNILPHYIGDDKNTLNFFFAIWSLETAVALVLYYKGSILFTNRLMREVSGVVQWHGGIHICKFSSIYKHLICPIAKVIVRLKTFLTCAINLKITDAESHPSRCLQIAPAFCNCAANSVHKIRSLQCPIKL